MGTHSEPELFQQEGYDLMAACFEVYLRATQKRVGYLVNFGSHPLPEWRRRVL